MAITLNIALTDAEQATVIEWLDVLMPNKTAAEKKRILEQQAKGLLRNDLVRRIGETRATAVREAENQARLVDSMAIDAPSPFA